MGKGSGRRPTLVGEETFEDNWRRTFGAPKTEPLIVIDECTEFDDADDLARMAAARAEGGENISWPALRGAIGIDPASAEGDKSAAVLQHGGRVYLLDDDEDPRDPVVFVEHVLGVHVAPWQAEILRKMVAPHDYREYLRRFLPANPREVVLIFAARYEHAYRFARELELPRHRWRFFKHLHDVYGRHGAIVYELETARDNPLYPDLRAELGLRKARVIRASLDRLVGVDRPADRVL